MPDIDDLVQLNNAGKTLKEIAIIYGVSVTTAQRWFKRQGISPRHDLGGGHQFTTEQRRELSKRMIAAQLGKPRTEAAKNAKALACERLQTHISPLENEFAAMLRAHGLEIRQQKAVGPYNVDLTSGTVAVEIFGGGWHNTHRDGERLRYLLNCGWSVIVVWVDSKRYPLTARAAEYVVSHTQLAKRDPASARGYRVIRGTGQLLSTGSPDPDDIPDVLTTGYRLDLPEAVPQGCCRCGCGEQTWVATSTDARRGWTKGVPVQWITGHQSRGTRWRLDQDGRREYSR